MSILFIDVIGGAAGDMLLAALLDAGAPIDSVRRAVDAVVREPFDIGLEDVHRAGLRCARLSVRRPGASPVGDLPPRSLGDLLDAVDRADLAEAIRARASKVLRGLGQAEAAVHGVPVGDVHLHELGDDDTLLDVVGIAAALDALAVTEIVVSPIPLGIGTPHRAGRSHGAIPMPAPVTLELLRGFRVRGGWTGETVTPTAAAVISAVARPGDEVPAMRVDAVGYGAGAADPAEVPNVVRVLLGTPAEHGQEATDLIYRDLRLLEANLDDLTPELVADAVRALTSAGVLDVWTTPVAMKKGRSGTVLSALCEPAAEARALRAFFEHSTTFGVRTSRIRRVELERRVVSMPLAEGEVRVKVGVFDGRVVSATPEHDDVAALAERLRRPVREVYGEAAAAARNLMQVEGRT